MATSGTPDSARALAANTDWSQITSPLVYLASARGNASVITILLAVFEGGALNLFAGMYYIINYYLQTNQLLADFYD